jgi:hypothetical protein
MKYKINIVDLIYIVENLNLEIFTMEISPGFGLASDFVPIPYLLTTLSQGATRLQIKNELSSKKQKGRFS